LLFVCLVGVVAHSPVPAPASRVCQFPSSGNIIWYIDADNYDRCNSFNNPKYTSYNHTEPCSVSEKCVSVVASFFCSQFCGALSNSSVQLPPCSDSCENYTACVTESPCLPSILDLGLPSCAQKKSWEADSSKYCTLLSVNLNRFSDGKDGYSQAGSGSRLGEDSVFFQGAVMISRLLRALDLHL